MTDRTTKLFALFAVTVMLGCALVPFAGHNSVAEADVSDTADTCGYSLNELICKIKELKQDDISVDYGLVPITESENEWTSAIINQDITSDVEVKSGERFELIGEYTFLNDKGIDIRNGGKIVIFPTDKEGNDLGFSLINKNDTNTNLIRLHSGALVEIMGITFRTICSEKGLTNTTLFQVQKTYAASPYPTAAFSFSYNKTDDKFDLSLKVGENTKICMHEFIVWYNEKSTKDIDVSGTVTKDAEGKVTFANCKVEMNVVHGDRNYTLKGTINKFAVRCVSTTSEESSVKTNLLVDVDLVVSEFNYSVGSAKESKLTITLTTKSDMMTVCTKNTISIEENTSLKDGVLDRKYTFSASEGIEIFIPNVKLTFSFEVPVFSGYIEATGLLITFKGVSGTVTEKIGETKDFGADVKSDVRITATELKSSEKIFRVPYLLEDIKDLDMSFDNLHFTYADDRNFAFVSDSIAIKFSCISNNTYDFNGYEPFIDLTVKKFSADIVDTEPTFKGSLDLAISVDDAGRQRFANLTAEVNYVKKESGIWYVDIGTGHFKNDLPTKTLVKKIHRDKVTLVDDFKVECEATNMKFDTDSHIFTAEKGWLRYENFNILDDFYVSFNDAVSFEETGETLTVKCKDVNGYTKYGVSDKESFTHSNLNDQLFINHHNPFTVGVIIDGGDVDLGKCVFPFEFKVTDKVNSFKSSGASALGFHFANNAKVSGTVLIDTTVSVESRDRIVSFNDEGTRLVIKSVIDEKMTGISMLFDLINLGGGQIVSKDGYILPDQLTITGLNIQRLDDHKATFTITGTGEIDVSIGCAGDGPYNLTFVDYGGEVKETKTYNYGDKVNLIKLDEVVTGHIFVGWTDSTGKVYSKDVVDYYMPAHDVILFPVYSLSIVTTPESSEGNALIDARGETVVQIDKSVVVSLRDNTSIDNIVIETDATEIVIPRTTLKVLTNDTQYGLWVNVSRLYHSDNELIQNKIADSTTYDISMKNFISTGVFTDVNYRGNTPMTVTLNVEVSSEKVLKNFVASYIDQYGHVEDVPIDSYKKRDDGTYDVTITVNHFSVYSVKPVYGSNSDMMFAIVMGAIVAAVIVAVVGMILYNGKFEN